MYGSRGSLNEWPQAIAMRILLIANGIAGTKAEGLAGGDSRLVEIAKHWIQDGHELHLMSGPGGVDLFQRHNLPVTPHVVPWWGWDGRWWFVLRAITVCVLLPWSLLRQRPDVMVSANDQLFDTLPGFLLKLWHRKRVQWAVVVHWLPPWKFWRRQGPHRLYALMYLFSEYLSLLLAALSANRVLAVSPSTARQLKSAWFPMGRVITVACGVDLAAAQEIVDAAHPPQHDAVLMKRLQASAGIFDLIDAWELVVRQRPDAKLAIIGDGVDAHAAGERVRARRLDGNITFLGAILDPDEKFRRVRASRLFTLPSHEENWSIVMGEAMALGVPVVAYDLLELKEVWGDAFRAVPKGDVSAFAGAVLDLLADEDGRRDLSERGLARVSSLDWAVIADRELEAITASGANGPATQS